MDMDNPLMGYINDAEKHMGADMYEAQVAMMKAQTKMNEQIAQQNIESVKHRMSVQSASVVLVFIMLLPFWLLAVVYTFKVVF